MTYVVKEIGNHFVTIHDYVAYVRIKGQCPDHIVMPPQYQHWKVRSHWPTTSDPNKFEIGFDLPQNVRPELELLTIMKYLIVMYGD